LEVFVPELSSGLEVLFSVEPPVLGVVVPKLSLGFEVFVSELPSGIEVVFAEVLDRYLALLIIMACPLLSSSLGVVS